MNAKLFLFMKKRNIFLLSILGIVIITGLVVYVMEKSSSNDEFISEDANKNAPITIETESDESEEIVQGGIPEKKPPPLSEAESDTAKKRDEQRVADIRTIRKALANFEREKGFYPSELSALVPEYLPEIPQDPLKSEYAYTPIGALPAEYYDLNYSMEVGVLGFQFGDHNATPDDLTIMQDEIQ